MNQKLWGGRFGCNTHPEVEAFTASFSVDCRLWQADLVASKAQARALEKAGVLNGEESLCILDGLDALAKEFQNDDVLKEATSEDIHSEIEKRLTDLVGSVAGKLHTGRSRNDQVATATRLYVREAIGEVISEIKSLLHYLVVTAEKYEEALLPGLTHLQHAQPVTLAHHLMAYFWMFLRDVGRLQDAKKD